MAVRAIVPILLFCSTLAISHAIAQQPKDTCYEITGTWSGQTLQVTSMKPGHRSAKTAIAEVTGPITASDRQKGAFMSALSKSSGPSLPASKT